MKFRLISKETFRRAIMVVPILIAVAVTATLVRARKGPELRDLKEKASAVRVIGTPSVNLIPRALGYGYVVPGKSWQAVAEVSGKVTEISPLFKNGSLCKEGTVLLRIDTAKYELAIAQTEAGIQSIRAQLAELDSQEENYKTSLEIEEKSLELSRKDLDRRKQMFDKDGISASQYDQQRVGYYAQQTRVQNLKNSLNLIPANRKTLKANLAVNEAKLKDTELDLRYTVIKAPFDCRITDVKAELAQFVQKGQVLATADGTKTAEIAAQIPMHRMRNLMRASDQIRSFESIDMTKLREILGITATVRLKSGDLAAEWEAELSRIDATVDPQTRTLGVIVSVEEPYRQMIIGIRPPLVRNMFCEVELRGKAIPGTVVIPNSALHEGKVYVMNPENRLTVKTVTLDFPQTDFYAVKEGLTPGEQLIVSDLIPAIEGMLLEPQEDKELAERLVAQATGNSKVK